MRTRGIVLSTDAYAPDILSDDVIIPLIGEKIEYLSQIRSTILQDKFGIAPIIALIIAILLNIWGYTAEATVYMVVWISASLYFYLLYPMLPLFLFPFRYFMQRDKKPEKVRPTESPLKWVVKIKILRNFGTGFRLFMRFFILSLLPLTLGMISIYFISVLFSLFLGENKVIPLNTSYLIFIQCAGIILFYIEIFFFRNQLVSFVCYINKQRSAEKKKIILLGISCFILLIIGTIVVILLLIAILLPGFTLVSFINMNEFVQERSNLWILVILISQIIIMQFLQNILSIKIAMKMCDDLIERLKTAKNRLEYREDKETEAGNCTMYQNDERLMRESMAVVREADLYAINRRQMFGLFPTYSVGINISALFGIHCLSDLRDVFFSEE